MVAGGSAGAGAEAVGTEAVGIEAVVRGGAGTEAAAAVMFADTDNCGRFVFSGIGVEAGSGVQVGVGVGVGVGKEVSSTQYATTSVFPLVV